MTKEVIDEAKRLYDAVRRASKCLNTAQDAFDSFHKANIRDGKCDHVNEKGESLLEPGYLYDICSLCGGMY